MADPKATTMLQKLGFMDTDLKNPKHDEIMIWLDTNAEYICKFLYPDLIKMETKLWEVPVLNRSYNSSYTIGFIDFSVRCSYNTHERSSTPPWAEMHETNQVSFEVKTSTPSIGEIIRQVNTYKTYSKYAIEKFVIVAPDSTYSKIFRSQDIEFIQYLPTFSGPAITDVLNQLRAAGAA